MIHSSAAGCGNRHPAFSRPGDPPPHPLVLPLQSTRHALATTIISEQSTDQGSQDEIRLDAAQDAALCETQNDGLAALSFPVIASSRLAAAVAAEPRSVC